VLGRRWFDQCKVVEPHRRTTRRCSAASRPFGREPRWQSLSKAGEEIGHRWQELPGEINRLAGKGESGQPAASLESLQSADALTRQIDGAGSLLLGQNPVEVDRRLKVEQLLIWQGPALLRRPLVRRGPAGEPYYRLVGCFYLEDAHRLDTRQDPRPSVQQLQQKLRLPGGAALSRRRLSAADHRAAFHPGLPARTGDKAAIPEGFAVAWLDVGKGLQAISPAGPARMVRGVGGDKPSDPVVATLSSPYLDQVESQPPLSPRVEKSGVTLQGLYRGQRIAQATNIDLFALANNIWYLQPLPPNGSIAVRASLELQTRFGDSNATIAIVLDCSAAWPPRKARPGGQTRSLTRRRGRSGRC